MHCFIGGKGSPVVLLHGYAETSYMEEAPDKLIPALTTFLNAEP
jgi:hypothetical protein